MLNRSHLLSLSLLSLAAGATSFACSASSQNHEDGDESAIIGGAEAPTKKLAAIGAIVPGYWTGGLECDDSDAGTGAFDGGSGSFDASGYVEAGVGPSCRYVSRWVQGGPVCTGTLVGPRTVITSRKCVTSISGALLTFTVGPNAWSPTETRLIVNMTSTKSRGHAEAGLDGDVTVVTLDSAIHTVEPLPLLPASQVRSMLASAAEGGSGAGAATAYVVGYGPDDRGFTGLRRIGQVKPEPRVLTPFQHAYDGDFAKFQREWPQPSIDGGPWPDGGALPGPSDAELAALWSTKLSESETYIASSADSAQARVCGADQGGPLLVARGGSVAIAGLFTIGLDRTPRCDRGAIFATIGADVEELVATESKCAELNFGGECEGSVATSCVETRGAKRIVRTDCAPLGLACRSGYPSAACVDPSEGDAGAP